MTAYPPRVPEAGSDQHRVWNWAHNRVLSERPEPYRPRTEVELQGLLRHDDRPVRVVGSRLSNGDLLAGGSGLLVSLDALSGLVCLDQDTATFGAGTRLQQVFDTLTEHQRMLQASPGVIAEQSLAGALATGTHGQGLGQSTLSDEVVSLRLVDAAGRVREVRRGDPDFGAHLVGLGALGVITRVTLRTVAHRVFTCHKDAVAADTIGRDLPRWNAEWEFSKAWWFLDDDRVHVWNAAQASPAEVAAWRHNGRELLSGSVGDEQLNATVDATLARMRADTVRGADGERRQFRTVTRFRDFATVTGDVYQVFCRGIAVPQINTEIGVPLADAPEILADFGDWYRRERPHLHYPVILRSTGGSQAWLSPAHDRETLFFGFVVYYADDGSLNPEGLDFLRAAERRLAAAGGRPHWGKYFDSGLYDFAAIYPRWEDFHRVRRELDPAGRFVNDWLGGLLDDHRRVA
ncbi:D-arabinono-1,4-lactone oxidase [Naumannella halotolerans]|uniref:FAD/FMN-containing dehydrogenase n=1 Tax=Naumannella halotolerans TaxID=993414 RepID=A0A4V3EN55_9ACTN|nr:D-arabinono-1,4-lactone oxidase [Naumannella halotolerans]TDT32508.1 FAD/FMN-containing dehydrogenase [Naumannella halotolerans]